MGVTSKINEYQRRSANIRMINEFPRYAASCSSCFSEFRQYLSDNPQYLSDNPGMELAAVAQCVEGVNAA